MNNHNTLESENKSNPSIDLLGKIREKKSHTILSGSTWLLNISRLADHWIENIYMKKKKFKKFMLIEKIQIFFYLFNGMTW